MPQEITVIGLSGVNCYLLKSAACYILIDSGTAGKRAYLEKRLKACGCLPGDLKLVILTHGDTDHTGNASWLRERFGAKIAIHAADAGMTEHGDIGCNRKAKSDKASFIFRVMMVVFPLFTKSAKPPVFKADLIIDESFDLSAYGLKARVIHLPGHSRGSIGVLTDSGELFCGDFIYNLPGFNLINDLADHRASLEKLRKLDFRIAYPGHGKPVTCLRFWQKYKE